MKQLTALFFIAFFSFTISAQTFDVPKNVVLEKKEDYKAYEGDVLKAINWLQNTPLQKEEEKRKQVILFFMQWITGSPNVSIELNAPFTDYGDCSHCLIVFMAGWTEHSLTNNTNDLFEGTLAGVNSTIDFYTKHKSTIGKNKKVESFIKMKRKGKLNDYIKSNIKHD